MELADCVAVVFGGVQGLGRSIAKTLLTRGAKVVVADVRKTAGDEVNDNGPFHFMTCDVTNQTQIEDVFKSSLEVFGKLNLVVNSACIKNENDPAWLKVVDVNVKGVVNVTKAAFKFLGKQNGGQGGTVVNVSSNTSLKPFPVCGIFASTKAFVNQYSASVGAPLYYNVTGVRVIAICPGYSRGVLRKSISDAMLETQRESNNEENETPCWQDPDHVGRALLVVLEKSSSGALWMIVNDKPPVQFQLEVKRI